MAGWLERGGVPATRYESHYGRVVRAFVARPRSVHALMEAALARRPEGEAVIAGERRVTYAQLDALVARHAGGLRSLGVEKGDRVALILGNSVEYVALLFALARLGAVSVPLNTRHTLAENAEILADCAAKVVVCESELRDRVPAPAGALRHVVAPADLAGSPVSDPEPVAEDETATILYTSGTTGRPKGAMLSHFGIAHSVEHFRHALQLTAQDRALLAVPMSHVTGLIALVHLTVHAAGALVVMPAFKASEFIDLVARERVTYSLIVPAMFNLCLLAPNFAHADLSCWRVAGFGGAIMPVATLEKIAAKMPDLKLLNCYGATETTSPATIMPPETTAARMDSVGLPVPCGEILVMDADGREVPPGEPGEIWIGGPMVVPGYFNNPEATAREFSGGYWKSGDLGAKDAEGYIRVVDRIKDVINRGGYKIFASEVEDVLLQHPAVVEAAVVAKPCPVLGERVHAFLVTRAEVEDAELQALCAGRLSDYKVPEAFHRVAATLPRNANGKVLKRDLRARLQA